MTESIIIYETEFPSNYSVQTSTQSNAFLRLDLNFTQWFHRDSTQAENYHNSLRNQNETCIKIKIRTI